MNFSQAAKRYHRGQTLGIYLSGPITGLTYDGASSWREHFVDLVPQHLCSSPMRLKEHLIDTGTIESGAHDDAILDDKAVVSRDRWDVKNSDVMVTNLLDAKRISIGTMVEYGWADAYDTFTITVYQPDEVHNHMFINQLSAVVVPTLEMAAEIVNVL